MPAYSSEGSHRLPWSRVGQWDMLRLPLSQPDTAQTRRDSESSVKKFQKNCSAIRHGGAVGCYL